MIRPQYRVKDTVCYEPKGKEDPQMFLAPGNVVYNVREEQTAENFWVVYFQDLDGLWFQAGFEGGSGLWAFEPQ